MYLVVVVVVGLKGIKQLRLYRNQKGRHGFHISTISAAHDKKRGHRWRKIRGIREVGLGITSPRTRRSGSLTEYPTQMRS